MTDASTTTLAENNNEKTNLTLIGILAAIVALCYADTLVGTADAWDSPMYSHGYLIPFFTLYLLYVRYQPFGEVSSKERWWGVGLITAGTVMRLAAVLAVQFTFDRLSLIVCLLGVFVFVGGFRSLKWAAAPLGFLVFMFPLPTVMVDNIMRPLQKLATISSVYALQVFGVDVYRSGNRIELEASSMNVVDQCSGLRMLTIFIALALALAMVSGHRPIWERILIVISSVPIALLVNAIRITVTGLLYNLGVNEDIVNDIFHDFAGLIMMPMALGFLFVEMQILQRLVIEDHSVPKNIGVGIGTPT